MDTQHIRYPYQIMIEDWGWIKVDETWTRNGNLTFTATGEKLNIYRKGAKVRYKENGVGSYEYGVIGSSSLSAGNTVVSLISNTDYAMANTTITDRYISFIENPEGFPQWFNWNADPQGFSAVPTSVAYRWTCLANLLTITYIEGVNGTSNATTFTATAPINASQSAAVALGATVDNSVLQTTPGRATLAAGSSTITLRKDSANGAWTASGGKRAIFQLAYEF